MKQYYSYENFKEDVVKLKTMLGETKPEAIVTLARGGYTLAHALSEALNIRNLQSLRTELYDDEKMREAFKMYGVCDLQGVKRVLVVDDIADSGKTLQMVVAYLQREFPHIEFQTATLFYKKTSCFHPDFWVQEATNWIEFFWEKDFS
jgi:xanthine phosphoribosyltransferase